MALSPTLEKTEKRIDEFPVRLGRKASAAVFGPQRVLIADDHGIMREALRSLLEERPGEFECVGEVEDGNTAAIMAKELRPEIKAELPDTKVVVLSMHANHSYVVQVLQAGASAYLLKDAAFEELSSALRAVRDGQIYLSPGISEAGAIRTEPGKPA